jgi:general secretion pathway protein D
MQTFSSTSMPNLAKSRVWLGLITSFLLVASLAIASSFPVTWIVRGDALMIRAETQIRYAVDYAERTVFIPNATLGEGEPIELPASVGGVLLERSDGLMVKMSSAFTTSVSVDGKTLIITRGTPSSSTNLEGSDGRVPVIFYLSYADPGQVATLLQDLYPNLVVKVDLRQRALIMRLTPEDRIIIQKAITLLDAPRPQVMFEAEVLEVNRSVTQSLGIDYAKLLSLNFRFAEGALAPGVVRPGTFTRQPISLEVGIQFLKSNGAARTLARPRVVTLDGVEARLNATQTRPIRVVQNGNSTLLNITTGITMRFLPKVTPDFSIESQLSISVSSPTEVVDNVPGYATREANTTVRVRNGEPIVIGGLLESRITEARTGIPGLMDIPVVGALFSTNDTSETNTDLIMIITPTIVGQVPELIPAPTNPSSPVSPPAETP